MERFIIFVLPASNGPRHTRGPTKYFLLSRASAAAKKKWRFIEKKNEDVSTKEGGVSVATTNVSSNRRGEMLSGKKRPPPLPPTDPPFRPLFLFTQNAVEFFQKKSPRTDRSLSLSSEVYED